MCPLAPFAPQTARRFVMGKLVHVPGASAAAATWSAEPPPPALVKVATQATADAGIVKVLAQTASLLQPVKVEPDAGVAVIATMAPAAYQPAPVTVPDPSPTAVIVREYSRPDGEGLSDTLKSRRAAVGSSLPAWSRALTSNVWGPAVRPVRVAVVALANTVNGPPSSRHAKTRLPGVVRLSVPPKVNVAVVAFRVLSGPPVIWVSGGVLSTMATLVTVV